VGCSEPFFWDTMTPFYGRLPKLPGLGVETSAERVGLTIVAATAAGFGAHGVGKAIQHRLADRRDARHREPDEVPAPEPGPPREPASPQEDER
jgi:hydrogenase small subunit